MEVKKIVVDGMKLSYTGPFDITEFYRTVEEWISSKGKEKEIKKRVEHVEAKGKKIEWMIEIWEDVSEYARSIVRVDAYFTDVKETSSKIGKKTKIVNNGNAMIIFDGILESDIQGRWQQKPWFYFIRAVYDKFVWKFYTNKFEDKLAADVDSLYETLNNFFNSYKV